MLKKEFFIGIDSDGTVFDSMTVKHRYAFIPSMINIWNMQSIEKDVYCIAEDINLNKKTRGINRFPGLIMTFEQLKNQTKFNLPDTEPLLKFCNSGLPMSNDSLCEFLINNPNEFLMQVLEWSRSADILFSKASENLPPFDGVAEAIKKMNASADLAIVSAAGSEGLKADWARAGLLGNMCYVLGQECGDKLSQLNGVLEGYNRSRSLMIGDAEADYSAAKEAGIMFYPIIARKESYCWKRFNEEILPRFFNSEYDAAAENCYMKEFRSALD